MRLLRRLGGELLRGASQQDVILRMRTPAHMTDLQPLIESLRSDGQKTTEIFVNHLEKVLKTLRNPALLGLQSSLLLKQVESGRLVICSQRFHRLILSPEEFSEFSNPEEEAIAALPNTIASPEFAMKKSGISARLLQRSQP